MAVIRKKELKVMGVDALRAKLADVRRELNSERGLVASGGRSSNPGRIKELRRTVARILTFIGQKTEAVLPAKPMPKTALPNKTPSGAGKAVRSAPGAKAAPATAKQ